MINTQPMTRTRFEQIVVQALNMISSQKIANLYRYNAKYLSKMI